VGPRSRVTRATATQASIGADVTVGPYAYLRPGTTLSDGVHIGTYVEVKGSEIGAGSKVPHLTYVGDATIGAHSNVGASSVFVNYDGVAKHRSVVGDHVRIGSDTMIVAPVEIGDGAYTAAGSVIVSDVPPGAMAVARGKQRNVAGWVARKRAGTPAAEAAERAQGESKEIS
jgi:bifunctional UDP-N-acetylglucosamine pyrophosphorylase/glucosamine-1-phosphate N-acetyltransferase